MDVGRLFITPDVDEYARKHRWTDDLFVQIVKDIARGLNDGALGSNVYKRRVARKGSGSSGGYRVVVVMQVGDKAFFVDAFAKNVKQKHTPDEVRALRGFADALLAMSDAQIKAALRAGDLREIHEHEEN